MGVYLTVAFVPIHDGKFMLLEGKAVSCKCHLLPWGVGRLSCRTGRASVGRWLQGRC